MTRTRPRPVVVIGLIGTQLDGGSGPRRWERWRPTVALCAHDDLVVDRLELLHMPRWTNLAEQLAGDVAQVSPETEVRLHVVDVGDPWDLEQMYGALHDFARSYRFRADREEYLVHITTGTHIAQICLFLLTESRHLPARLIQSSPSPADRSARRPGPGRRGPGSYAIIDLDLSRYDRLASRFEREHADAAAILRGGIATRSPVFNRLIDELERVAVGSREPILLLGPTGSGKSHLARRIHDLKRSRHGLTGPLVEVNCATLRGDAATSALFGHVKGAFTGAAAARPGFLRQADGGVLFLDEIGELGVDEQALLLRAIEDRRWPPMGSDHEVSSDFQLLAGTNRDLPALVAAGRFRADLLARIDLWTFRLPGLAERREDLAPNLDHELEQASAAVGVRVAMTGEARQRFLAFATSPEATWPGNFRDLRGAVRRMATLAPGGRIGAAQVATEIDRLRAAWSALAVAGPAPAGAPGDRVAALLGAAAADLDRFDRIQLAAVLDACAGARSLSEAGRRLFAASRARKTSSNDADRLRKYLARFGLRWDRGRGAVTPA